LKNYGLRKIRVAVSVVFLLLTAALFLDITNYIPTNYFNWITFLQFIPSAIKFANVLTISSIGFIIVLILTLMFGRIYCSSICPLGTIQDIISRIAKKNNRKKKFTFTKEYFWLRYSTLALTIVSILFGTLIIVNLLDPYSNTGRILSQLFNPIITIVNNIVAFTLEKFNVYLLYPVEIKSFYFVSAMFPFMFLLVVLYLSYKRGRLFCNSICPVGTLLGIVSKFTIFKLKIDKASCEGCGVCARVCKSECIEPTSKEIDFSRCVACYNCLDVCPSDSINYQFISSEDIQQRTDDSRRNFLSRTTLFFVGLGTTALSQIKIIPKKETKVEVKKKFVSSPPGSKSLDHFTSNCTACHLCITACPTRVLQPSIIEYGIFSIFQPFMDYKTNFCNFDCTVCGEVCPTSAILPITKEKKQKIQIGKSIFVKENCIVETENTACGACSEHCPTKAVMMVDYKGNLKIPEVNNKYCVGCGACEYACPTKPYKAIYVDGNFIHEIAEINPTEKLDQKIDYKEEFPF
jgi:ferredoxin